MPYIIHFQMSLAEDVLSKLEFFNVIDFDVLFTLTQVSSKLRECARAQILYLIRTSKEC